MKKGGLYVNKNKNLYPNTSFENDYKEHILKQLNKESRSKNDNKNMDNSKSIESKVETEIQAELETIKSLINQLLENQGRIIDELMDLKSVKIERRSSLVDRIFRSD
jgi:hypothetical protein